MLSSQWLLCIHCFTTLVSFTGFYTEYEPYRVRANMYVNLKEGWGGGRDYGGGGGGGVSSGVHEQQFCVSRATKQIFTF